ncbi:MAG: deoxyguanosinetriphosphate triphosphohydrolase [Gammaproteobacteria bacterium]|nr:deoxyguanosinetriphosphate triphosphohydrolase [Gammaproteobacteria bacterium]MDH5692628.1 deoxyguanosinetriphosphate triphosphohydrolase [Gammaproteobacteria bacterium]
MNGLAPYAANETNSRGRKYPEPAPTYRTEFQRDRDRIVHSTAFRRLEYKTQVFVNHEGDLFRTRLTHSIEVAQIGRAMARALHLNEDLTEAISLAHDLGHTPFGHAGQDALNHCMRDFGGFEHNLQSLRVVEDLEEKYADFNGLNLTYEAREGILKHCSPRHAQTLGQLGERFINKHQPSLEAQLANLADEIAYNNHDVDDGIRAQLIGLDQLSEIPLFSQIRIEVEKSYPTIEERRKTHEIVRRMIDRLANDLIETTTRNLAKARPQSLADVRNAKSPLVSFSPEIQQQNLALKRFLRENLYSQYRVYRMAKKARIVVSDLFNAFFEDPKLLPQKHLNRARNMENNSGDTGRARAIADYIAGMTDRYAIMEHGKLFEPIRLT